MSMFYLHPKPIANGKQFAFTARVVDATNLSLIEAVRVGPEFNSAAIFREFIYYNLSQSLETPYHNWETFLYGEVCAKPQNREELELVIDSIRQGKNLYLELEASAPLIESYFGFKQATVGQVLGAFQFLTTPDKIQFSVRKTLHRFQIKVVKPQPLNQLMDVEVIAQLLAVAEQTFPDLDLSVSPAHLARLCEIPITDLVHYLAPWPSKNDEYAPLNGFLASSDDSPGLPVYLKWAFSQKSARLTWLTSFLKGEPIGIGLSRLDSLSLGLT